MHSRSEVHLSRVSIPIKFGAELSSWSSQYRFDCTLADRSTRHCMNSRRVFGEKKLNSSLDKIAVPGLAARRYCKLAISPAARWEFQPESH